MYIAIPFVGERLISMKKLIDLTLQFALVTPSANCTAVMYTVGSTTSEVDWAAERASESVLEIQPRWSAIARVRLAFRVKNGKDYLTRAPPIQISRGAPQTFQRAHY